MGTRREDLIRPRVLLVEQDRHGIDYLRDAFSEQGCECEVALDLSTARSILRVRKMDVVVLNAELPGYADEEVIPEFRQTDPELHIIVYNGTGDKSRQRRYRRMGADSYLSKASDLSAVLRAVGKVLAASA